MGFCVGISCTMSQPNLLTPPVYPPIIQGSYAPPIQNPAQPNPNPQPQTPIPNNGQETGPQAPTQPHVRATTRNQIYPFDLQLDTVAYMTCPSTPQGIQSRDLFSFKFASLKHGVSLSPEFLQDISQRKQKSSKSLSSEDIEPFLKQSPYLNTYPQISLSTIDNPLYSATQYADIGASALNFNEDIEKMSRYRNVQTLANGRPFIAFFPVGGQHISQVINFLRTGYAFHLSYNHHDLRTDERQILAYSVSSQPKYYGRTYDLQFKGGRNDQNFISEVKEKYSITQKTEGRWSCRENVRLPIFRHQTFLDAIHRQPQTAGFFKQDHINLQPEQECHDIGSSEAKQKERRLDKNLLELIVPSFNVGEIYFFTWNDTESKPTGNLCLVPKHAGTRCYSQSILRVEFENEESCLPNSSTQECPAYFSVCQRQ